jgi:hypothetical protein
VRPYFEVRPDDPEARDALNKLVGFDVHETEKRGWAWLEARTARKRDEWTGEEALSIPEPVVGEEIELTKVRAVEAELTNAIANLKFMNGPERTAGKRWNGALVDLMKAIDQFLPYARVRATEDSYFAGKVSPGGRDRYDAIHTSTVEIGQFADALAMKAKEAQTKIATYQGDPLPGLEPKKPHRNFLAQLCARLSLAGFTFPEIGDLVPDPRRLDDERQEAQYRTTTEASGDPQAQLALARHREQYRKEHSERIRSLVSGAKPKIIQTRVEMARAADALDSFLVRTGYQSWDMKVWCDEYLASPECLASQEPVEKGQSAGE